MNKQIETVRFYSDIERTLAASYMEIAHSKPEEQTTKESAKKHYDLMKAIAGIVTRNAKSSYDLKNENRFYNKSAVADPIMEFTALCLLDPAEPAVMVFAGKCYVFSKPFRRSEAVSGSFVRKFHFCQHKRRKIAAEYVKFDG